MILNPLDYRHQTVLFFLRGIHSNIYIKFDHKFDKDLKGLFKDLEQFSLFPYYNEILRINTEYVELANQVVMCYVTGRIEAFLRLKTRLALKLRGLELELISFTGGGVAKTCLYFPALFALKSCHDIRSYPSLWSFYSEDVSKDFVMLSTDLIQNYKEKCIKPGLTSSQLLKLQKLWHKANS